ncbi:MAG: Hsp20/alpha crystallin family protein [Anaerolineales bacterium]|nr:Hsp20/alpha crystallin family protein [Anaerolineales bacterium]
MRVVRWSPTQDLVSLRDAMDRLFEESWVRPSSGSYEERSSSRAWRLPLDVYSTDEEIVIQAATPGIAPEAVEITIEGDTLTIRGDMPAHLENVNYLFNELPTGRFVRALNLNIPVDAERAEASFSNGLLTLVIPKAEEIKPRQIKVKTE